MRRIGLYGALALLVVVNVAVLAGVAWNRSGEPVATLRLTERELPLDTGFASREEDSGLALRLSLAEGSHSTDWLDENRLRSLGFRPERYYPAQRNGARYAKQPLPLSAWVVLEYDGPAWQAVLMESEKQVLETRAGIDNGKATLQQLEYHQQQLEQLRSTGSRLVAVDAGTDPVALHVRYADRSRYLISRAKLRIWISRVNGEDQTGEAPVAQGSIAQVLPARIHVPLEHRAALWTATDGKQDQPDRPADVTPAMPRYEVVLHYGKRHEPWVAGISIQGQ